MTSLFDLTATTPNLPCRSVDPELFFSKISSEREQAKQLCQTCPIKRECAQYALDHRDVKGVWGGTTAAGRRQFWTGEPSRFDEQGRLRLACGSERAYRAHFSYREQPCDACLAAHQAQVEGERRAQLVVEHAKGGSSRGYFIHRRLGEVACVLCRAGQGREAKARREQQRAEAEGARASWGDPWDPRTALAPQTGVQSLAIAS